MGAPARTAPDRSPEALALAGWSRWRVAGRDELARALRRPLDLVVVWEGIEAPGPVEVAGLVQKSPVEVPVVAVLPPQRLSAGIDLVEHGVSDFVASDRLERLGAIAHRVLSERWLRFLPELTSVACHELNNLLVPIPLAATLLRPAVEREDRETLEDLESAAVHATRTVDALYRFALHSADQDTGGCGSVEVLQIIEMAARRLREAHPGLVVETTPSASQPSAELGSARALLRVLLCLAMEAVDQLAEDRPLRIKAEAGAGGREWVTVAWRARPRAPALTLAPELEATVEEVGCELEIEAGLDEVRTLRLVLPTAAPERRR